MDLKEARKNLENCISEETRKEYFHMLRRWHSLAAPMTKDEFDSAVRKLLTKPEQLRAHNRFVLAIESKPILNKMRLSKSSEKSGFELADYSEYVQPTSPSTYCPPDFVNRTAASELFMPDHAIISNRIAILAWENRLDGAEYNVTDVIVNACQTFVKNIITAMITKKKGYKMRDGKFQFGFNQPIPDPFIRNYNNLIDDSEEFKVEVDEELESFVPKSKVSLECAQQQTAFAYACAKRQKTDNMLTVKLLYDTLMENPNILGLNSSENTASILKLGLQYDVY